MFNRPPAHEIPDSPIQYSYTQRQLFYASDVGNEPQIGESIGMFSFRYYPF